MHASTVESPGLALRLKTETAALHERMHELMAQAQPFASRERYARFVAVQYLFQRDVEHLFDDAGVRELLPDLDTRGRQAAALADLRDLGAEAPSAGSPASVGVDMPAALGWLYVSEGSTLGAAFLLKEVKERLGLSEDFGARNLAAYPEGRAASWRRFVAALDSDGVDAEAHQAVIEGARAAFDRYGRLLARCFGLELPPVALSGSA